jgi:protein-L-isoaspartate(D-aspartate) O-methyltransferase
MREWMTMTDKTDNPFPWADQWPEIVDPRVRAAFAVVERRAFLDAHLARFADQDAPLPIGEGQTISQPFVVALMLQALDIQPGERVLEIGAGSGFQTALLCELAATAGDVRGETVYAVERHRALAGRAAAVLDSLGYAPQLRVGDGALGWPEAAPFAAIVVSAAAPHLPRPLWAQLAEGGRLILPVGAQADDQQLWLVRKLAGQMQIERLGGVRFVPLISPLFDDPDQWAEE